jgi:Protein of unknown function (DUF3037)
VPERVSFDYAPIWIVPRVERDERIAAGVLLRCLARDFLAARVALDDERLAAIGAAVDLDVARLRRHLDAIVQIAAGGPAGGPLGRLGLRDRWHWLVAPRSTVIQTGPVHAGLCDDPAAALDHLVTSLVPA